MSLICDVIRRWGPDVIDEKKNEYECYATYLQRTIETRDGNEEIISVKGSRWYNGLHITSGLT